MNDWRQMLREHDPGAAHMDPDTAARIRGVVVRAAAASASRRAVWPMRCALAAFAGVVVMMSVFGTQRAPDVAPERVLSPANRPERRQIQFATPGGTRIIWELNPNFTLETLP